MFEEEETVAGELKTSHSATNFDESKTAEAALMNSPPVTKLTDSNTLHDRVLVVGSKKFYVQTGLLSFYSETFHGLFFSDCKEAKQTEIKLHDIDPNELETFLLTMYPDQQEITEENILYMIKLSYYYLAPWVMKKCNDFIERNFKNIGLLKAALLDLASSHQITTLQEKLSVDSCQNLSSNGSNPVDLLECAIKHNLQTLKTTAVQCVCSDVKRFRNDYFRLLTISFNHDILELKVDSRDQVSIRTEIFNNVTRDPTTTVSVNSFLSDNLPEILKQSTEIMQFILRSVVSAT